MKTEMRPAVFFTTHKGLHLALIVALMVAHTFLHYAAMIPGVGQLVEHVPYFHLHRFHEAEYLAIVAYASLVFRLRGGVIVLLATAVASMPFVFVSDISNMGHGDCGFSGLSGSLIDFFVLLSIGAWLVFINEMWGREQDRRTLALAQLQRSHEQLQEANAEVQETNQQLESSNRQLSALNQTVQSQINKLFGDISDLLDREARGLQNLPPGPARDRFDGCLDQLRNILGR